MNSRRKESTWMTRYQRQTGWIDGEGILVWLSDYFSLLGSMGFLISMLVGDVAVMLFCWLIVIFASFLHVLHSKHPTRLVHMIKNVKTSWMSRGMLFSLLFAVIGLVHVISLLFLRADVSWFSLFYVIQQFFVNLPFFNFIFRLCEILCPIANFILCIAIWLYEAMMLSKLRSVPVFNNGAVPVIFFVTGAMAGLGMEGFAMSIRGDDFSLFFKLLLIGACLCAVCYASFFFSAKYSDNQGDALRRMMKRPYITILIIGCVVLGVLGPAFIASVKLYAVTYVSFLRFFDAVPMIIYAIAVAGCTILSSAAFSFVLFKCATYKPVVKTM